MADLTPGQTQWTSTATVATYQGNAFETLRSRTGGFLDLRVDLQSPVSPGQLVACQRNAFGDVV